MPLAYALLAECQRMRGAGVFYKKEYISRMSTGLKALGVVGAGALLALGISASEPTLSSETGNPSNCHPSYSGCLKMNAGDYDCAGGSGNGPNYTGQVQVFGADAFGLDRDHDGWGCE